MIFFFHKLAERREFCEELLQTIFNNDRIKIREHVPQRSLRNVKGRSVTVDLLCQDKNRVLYGVEMQRQNRDNHQKRVRYVGANIDTHITEKGIAYQNLWNVHMVYISEFDVFHGEKTIYHISRTIDELQKKVYNGIDEIYVNTKIHDGSLLAELMEIFKSTKVPNHPKFPRISKAIRYYKEGKGREEMCKIMEDFAKEQQALGRESGREEMREEMQVKMREEMCKIMEDFAKEQQALGRESGREEMREEMRVKMRRYGKKQRHTGRQQGRNEGRREGRKELVSVITLLRNGKDEEEIRCMGYDEATIKDASMVLR